MKDEVLCRILSVKENIVMDMNDVMYMFQIKMRYQIGHIYFTTILLYCQLPYVQTGQEKPLLSLKLLIAQGASPWGFLLVKLNSTLKVNSIVSELNYTKYVD